MRLFSASRVQKRPILHTGMTETTMIGRETGRKCYIWKKSNYI